MDLNQYVADEMAKYNGVCFPVKSGMLRRLFVRTAKCSDLHPNPDDEFCKPEVGPSFRIISEYEQKMKEAGMHPYGDMDESNEPIIVEKMYPEGYIIINGHHRWGASIRLQKTRMNIKIVNLTHEDDIRKMLERSSNDKRVTFDLDEVVFGKEGEEPLEKNLPFPFKYEYKERLRSGIPALFNHLSRNGYDIWVYSANYYSVDYLKHLFRRYHVKVDGMITGGAKRSKEAGSRIDKLISEKYKTTVHIDKTTVLKTFTGNRDFIDKETDISGTSWSLATIRAFDEIRDIVVET